MICPDCDDNRHYTDRGLTSHVRLSHPGGVRRRQGREYLSMRETAGFTVEESMALQRAAESLCVSKSEIIRLGTIEFMRRNGIAP